MTNHTTSPIIAALLAGTAMLGAGLLAGSTPVLAASSATTQADTTTMDKAIERYVLILDRASKHPAGRAGGLILRGYAAYRQYRNGRDITAMKGEVAGLRQTVHDMLSDIAALIERIEQGEELSDAQWAAAEQALDNHAARLAGLESRMDRVEQDVDATRRQLDEIDAGRKQHEQRLNAANKQIETLTRQLKTHSPPPPQIIKVIERTVPAAPASLPAQQAPKQPAVDPNAKAREIQREFISQ